MNSKEKFYNIFEKVTKTKLNEGNFDVPNSMLNINDAGSRIIISMKNNQGLQIPVDKQDIDSLIQTLQRFNANQGAGNMRLSSIRDEGTDHQTQPPLE